MGRHEQHSNYIFPSDSSSSPDPEYFHNILPDAITSFHCIFFYFRFNFFGLLSNFFDLVAIHAPTGTSTNVVSMPNNSIHKDRVGELCINADMLSVISDQWLIEVEISAAREPSNMQTQFHMKTNFVTISSTDTLLMSTMQTRLLRVNHSHNINTQATSQTFFHLFDIVDTKTSHPTAKWLAIRQYANSSGRGVQNFHYYEKLRSISLSIYGNIELIQEKFKNVINQNEQIINGVGIGKHPRIGIILPGLMNHKLNTSSKTMYFKSLSHQESPWLECTTTKKINAIQLEIQDEYGQALKSSTTNDLLLNVTITFADVPEEAI